MSAWTDLFENRTHSLVMYSHPTDYSSQSWIGGNAPAYFDDDAAFTFLREQNYLFYLSVTLPDIDSMEAVSGQEMISVFVPADYERYLENNIYPTCDIQVFQHPVFSESTLDTYTNPALLKHGLTAGKWMKDEGIAEEPFLVKIGCVPKLIQQEDSYIAALHQDGYDFLIQIDEEGYTDGMVDEYVFGYGALYLFAKFDDGKWIDPIAGFWQYS
ncbi:hypothetical protein [Paenibacillus sp. ACRRY]|uniref:hypothetical protein n=1 Tax=Paenibacillus sp. ACRRY TaxID=2918208 RepID=UPI001EF492C4|nr:hypothetical protein [Paenibacillus sp. ACRRY]MCG7383102.1 hypothetical protein [Paenibacillus sp. ACRRY]